MQLTQTLLGYLNRIFDKDPDEFLALRIAATSTVLIWQVQDGILTITPATTAPIAGGTVSDDFSDDFDDITTGGPLPLVIDLSQYTIASLAQFILVQPGYSVPFLDPTSRNQLSALVLLDGTSNSTLSNGASLFGYTSLLWSYMEANAAELEAAETQIANMLLQMSTTTSADTWLDFLGNFYGIPRGTISSGGVTLPEPDQLYGPRIIQTVLAPAGNNIAIANAITALTGVAATVTDFQTSGPGFPLYNGVITFNGAQQFHSSASTLYNLFNVNYGFNLLGGDDPTGFAAHVAAIVNTLRDAGTHLNALNLTGSQLTDSVPNTRTDAITLFLSQPDTYNGAFPFDGSQSFNGLATLPG